VDAGSPSGLKSREKTGKERRVQCCSSRRNLLITGKLGSGSNQLLQYVSTEGDGPLRAFLVDYVQFHEVIR
jgi:hypothetical protein